MKIHLDLFNEYSGETLTWALWNVSNRLKDYGYTVHTRRNNVRFYPVAEDILGADSIYDLWVTSGKHPLISTPLKRAIGKFNPFASRNSFHVEVDTTKTYQGLELDVRGKRGKGTPSVASFVRELNNYFVEGQAKVA